MSKEQQGGSGLPAKQQGQRAEDVKVELTSEQRIALLERQLAEQRQEAAEAKRAASEATRAAEVATAQVAQMEQLGSERRHYQDREVRPAASQAKRQWRFQVRCAAMPKGHPNIDPATIVAVDESEAIRMFCLMRRDEKDRQLDAGRYQFQASCLDEKERKQLQINRINNRRALEQGRLPLALERHEEELPLEVNAQRQREAIKSLQLNRV